MGAVVKRVDSAVRATVVARLRGKRAEGAAISADVRRVSVALSVGERTVWRWLGAAEDASCARSGYQLSGRSGRLLGLVWQCRGAAAGPAGPG